MSLERLDKLIASQGIYSRKEVKALISERRVCIDGVPAKSAEQKLDIEKHLLSVDGTELIFRRNLYLVLHKPKGYVSSTDGQDGPSVLELVPKELFRPGLFPAGRLDKDTTGLMIITDDGQFAHRILAPKKHVRKKYLVTLNVPPTQEMQKRFAEGIDLSEGKTKPSEMEFCGTHSAFVTLTEGRYHQIKRMFSACGATVVGLHRVEMGNFSLPADLPEGDCRLLTEEERSRITE